MTLLAAQARFGQTQKRMQLPLGELPGDLFHTCLQVLRNHADRFDAQAVEQGVATLRGGFDESAGRQALLARLVTEMGNGAIAALSVDHAGTALFLTALSLASGQDRDRMVTTTHDRLAFRLAVALRAAGLKPDGIARNFAVLFPDIAPPVEVEGLRSDEAARLLHSSATHAAA
jgi:hypothetical protein